MRHRSRAPAGGSVAPHLAGLALALVFCACDETDAGLARAAPKRLALFARMEQATLETLAPVGETAPARPEVDTYDFDAFAPEELWLGRPRGRRLELAPGLGEHLALESSAGLTGGALRLGPGLADEGSCAVLVRPVSGMTRVRIAGRARLEGNPSADDASSREVLRVIEHRSSRSRPSRTSRDSSSSARRVSRRVDPSGWDRFELSFTTGATAGSIEVRLLHQSGGSDEARTLFDDLSISREQLSESETYEVVRADYLPRDGNEDASPWRLRVSLQAAGGGQSEVRDAVLLPAPARLSIPVSVPPLATRPRLRFQYGMLSEGVAAGGDGARLSVAFEPPGGEEIPLGTLDFDPKNDRAQRGWHEARFDLTPVAGREGRITFVALDIPDTEPDLLDAVVLSTPRIEPSEEPPGGFNVLLIGVDTLRADRMSAFGYERPTTPNLARLADAGVRFPAARSQAPWTLPSFSSILTSLYPSAHGAGRGGHDEWTPIDPTTTSLAEILSRLGYETQGLVANGLISPRYGLDQGFEAYRSAWAMESAGRDAPDVAGWIGEHTTTPWLFFWHVMDPHLPYSTEDSYRAEFTDAGYDGRFAGPRPSVPFEVLDPRPGRRWFTYEGPPPPPDLSESDRRFVNDYYDAEIAEMDAAVGLVLDALRTSDQWERTIVAFVADHGEGLGDHDHYHHGYTLFEDQVRVPMILRVPGRDEGRVVERPVAAIDLAPTILGALALEPPGFFQGVDRLAPDAPRDDAYFIEYPTYDSSAQKAWILGDFKYLHDPVFHTEALYDLRADPGEHADVAAAHPEVVRHARAALDAFRWQQLQKGRYHLRLRARPGQRLELAAGTDDLFDANFAARPAISEQAFAMDLLRSSLTLDATLAEERLELVFWCRGTVLAFDLKLDGATLPGGIVLGSDGQSEKLPLRVPAGEIPLWASSDVGWPAPGSAMLWLETGAAQTLPVVLGPEEIEVLRELGYAR